MKVAMRTRNGCGRVAAIGAVAVTTFGTLATATTATASEAPMAPVVVDVLSGDLVMAGNSNLLTAGGWRPDSRASADVDGDTSKLCIARTDVRAICADNSSSATLDVPAGARIVAARLYVDTTLAPDSDAIRVRLDGPAAGYSYTELTRSTDGVSKLAESTGDPAGPNAGMRQAVWDVTDYVAAAGSGSYTVADIAAERTAAYLPYASWAIVAAYELDPAADVAALSQEELDRFAPRAISWHDGFVVTTDGTVDVPVTNFQVPAGEPVFGKTFHVVAHGRHRGADNLLLGGRPLGNNAVVGAEELPTGVVVGADPSCNSTTAILNDSICLLGAPVVTKSPGPDAYVAVVDGRTASSGSGVDMDVTRIPGRVFVPGSTSATLSLQTHGQAPVATGVLAASIDLPGGSTHVDTEVQP